MSRELHKKTSVILHKLFAKKLSPTDGNGIFVTVSFLSVPSDIYAAAFLPRKNRTVCLPVQKEVSRAVSIQLRSFKAILHFSVRMYQSA